MQVEFEKQSDGKKNLPLFRHDLELYPGPTEPDGAPSFNLYDPLNGKYYKISWIQSLVMKHLKKNMTMDQLINKIQQKTTVRVTEQQIRHFFNHAASLGILSFSKTASQVEVEAEALRLNPFKWVLFHYLYFRIPLCNPDRFLGATLPYVKVLVSKPFIALYVFLIVIGLGQLFARFDEFIHTFQYFFTFQGILIFGLAMSSIKILHELGHAYTAKNYGVDVQKMGVAFLVLWPVLFTDVTDGWRLSKRSQRFAISVAGVVVEIILAGICSFLWAISEPGPIQSVFFVVTSATWISTLAVNLNPAMRFDGYYLLSDLWGVENLQPRAFAVARWALHKWVLGIDQPPPEHNLSMKRMIGMVVYSIFTWIYRIFLYTAIALFVYHYFTRIVGVFLFFLEIAIFFVWPLVSEVQILLKMRDRFSLNKRFLLTLFCASIFLVWFVIPFRHIERFSAVTIPYHQQVIYVPHNGVVKKIYVERNEHLKRGQLLLSITSDELLYEIRTLLMQKEILEHEIRMITFNVTREEERGLLPEKEAELERIVEHLLGLAALNEKLTLRAQFAGTLYDWDPDLYINQPVYKDQILGKIADVREQHIQAYIPEESLQTIQEGQNVTFLLAGTYQPMHGKVIRVTPSRSQVLNYPQLASTYGGELPVTQNKQGELNLVDTYYTAVIALNNSEKDHLRYGQIGYIETKGPARSKMLLLIQSLQNLFWSESGF